MVKNILLFFFLSLSLMPKSSQYDAPRSNCSLPSPFTQTWWPSFTMCKARFLNTLPWPFIVRACRGSTYLHSLMATTACIRPWSKQALHKDAKLNKAHSRGPHPSPHCADARRHRWRADSRTDTHCGTESRSVDDEHTSHAVARKQQRLSHFERNSNLHMTERSSLQ